MMRGNTRTFLALVSLWCTGLSGWAREGDRLDVFPDRVELRGSSARQQVVVTRLRKNGASDDLTRLARFRLEPEGVATIDETGLVRPLADGKAVLTAVSEDGLYGEIPVDVVGSTERPAVSYRLEISAILSRAGCNMGACHGNLLGKGGFRLSLRGEDPTADFDTLTRDHLGRRISRLDPYSSLLLAKPLGRLIHEGGKRFDVESDESNLLGRWIVEGTHDDEAIAPRLTGLSVYPAEQTLRAPRLEQQLVVTAEFSDGSRRDVTHLAAFDVDDPMATKVERDGRAVRKKPGESVLAIRYLDGRATARLAFLPDRSDFQWEGPEPVTTLDEAVFQRLRELEINPSPPAPGSVLVRRLYLDLLGVLPSPEEVRESHGLSSPAHRVELANRLMNRPEFAEFWALKWSDLLKNEEKAMGPKGVWALQRWLRDRISEDAPATEIVRAMVASSGSTWQNPAASFYRTNRDPEACAESFAQVFLGVRIQCARCHNHPFDVWKQDDYYGLAAAFSNITRKQVNNKRRDTFDKHENNGDEIISISMRPAGLKSPRSGELLPPAPPGEPALRLGPGGDPRDELADWLTRDNRQFARNMANRVWYHLMGRGVVDPVDDFRSSNPPSNPELLEELTDAYIAGGYRLRPLVSLIVQSEVYRLDATPTDSNRDDEIHPSRARVKPLAAEVLLDAISSATGHSPRYPSAPKGARAAQLAGVQVGNDFLKVFGKPERLLACECERYESTTLAQAFQLVNGENLRECLEAPDNRIGRLLDSGVTDEEILEELYLGSISRLPSPEERLGAIEYLSQHPDRRRAWEDLLWALINSKEFLLRR